MVSTAFILVKNSISHYGLFLQKSVRLNYSYSKAHGATI